MITARAFAGKKYAVYGLARSGRATVEALLASDAEVVAWDEKAEARDALDAHYATELGETFTTAGLCLYRDGADSVAWHGDTIGRGRRADTMVAIVSLGSSRDFLLRHRTDYATAVREFRWPELRHFNWALDHFDRLAEEQAGEDGLGHQQQAGHHRHGDDDGSPA